MHIRWGILNRGGRSVRDTYLHGGKLPSVGRPRLFGTSATPAQPRLFGLDTLGETGWLKALRLDGYAPRRPPGRAGLAAGALPLRGSLLRNIGNSWIERHSRVRLNLSAVHSPLYSTEDVSKLMREPVFNETLQLGIVVRDLEATVRRYVDDYGIGPWQFAQIDLGDANNYREYGQPVERSNRTAFATVGRVMWELIEPLDEEGIYARFLAEKGEGIHQVAVATANFDETVARAEREHNVILSGEFSGAKFAFLATERDLGVILEVFSFSVTPDEEAP